ncbi:MAG TPA: response regulator receiver protein, partial [Pseudolabrys sp.]|nr:response regulator receiver protein [Pseudolabrys sp.]
MPERDSTRTVDKKRGILVSTDAEFAQFVRSAFSADAKLELADVNDLLRDTRRSDIGDAAVVIVDMNDDMQNWSGLELLAGKVGARIPIVVVVRTFDGATARRLVQMRVADILVKPITPSELVRACHRVIQGTGVSETRDSKIFTFLPAAG